MEFLNEPVRVESLPQVEAVPLVPIEQAYLKVLRLEWAITVTILMLIAAVLVVFIPPLQQPVWVTLFAGGLLCIGTAWYIVIQQSFRRKAYAIRERDIIYQTGWIVQSIHACPFNRIQHSTVTMGPLERKFGLATLVLYTAGSGNADLQIPGLQEETARSLKAWITKKIADEPSDPI